MIDPKKKTIVFDFGNVIINLDHKKVFSEFHRVLGIDFSKSLPEKTEAVLHRYEKGEINTESFLWALQQYNPEAPIREVISAWNSILGNLPMARLSLIASLRENYNLAILSNINEMHELEIHKRLERDLHIIDFKERYFDKVYYSHHVGLRKPDQTIYKFVAKDLGVTPHNILFIDDLQENVAAAKKCGWNAIVHNPKEDIINNMASYIESTFK